MLGKRSLLCLDEPSSGMDPQARQELRGQIEAYARSGRSVLLTSHAMDECQDLCTRLGVMVNGRFVCLGTPAQLRLKFGKGYTISLKCIPDDDATLAAVDSNVDDGSGGGGGKGSATALRQMAIARLFPGAVIREEHSGYLNYTVPLTHMPPLEVAFAGLEQLRRDGAVEDYELSRTTLEDIFCQFARQQRELGADDTVDAIDGAPGSARNGGDIDSGDDVPLLE